MRGTLREVPAEVFATATATTRAKQVVEALLRGPDREDLVGPLPEGTLLRSLFIDNRGTAYVSVSEHAMRAAPGGSSWELVSIHSLTNSLVRSVPEVERVQVLVEGQEIETLTGHVDLSRPLTFSAILVDAARAR